MSSVWSKQQCQDRGRLRSWAAHRKRCIRLAIRTSNRYTADAVAIAIASPNLLLRVRGSLTGDICREMSLARLLLSARYCVYLRRKRAGNFGSCKSMWARNLGTPMVYLVLSPKLTMLKIQRVGQPNRGSTMRANLFWFNDEQWANIRPLLPTNQPARSARMIDAF